MTTPRDRLLKKFRDLVEERLGRISAFILTLESGGDVETGRKVLRDLHGLKGEARMMGFDRINTLVHEMEELVRAIEPAQYAFSHESADALLKSSDAVIALSGMLASDNSPEVAKLVAVLRERTRIEQSRFLAVPPVPDAALPVAPPAAEAPVAPSRHQASPGMRTPTPPPLPGNSALVASPRGANVVRGGAGRNLWTPVPLPAGESVPEPSSSTPGAGPATHLVAETIPRMPDPSKPVPARASPQRSQDARADGSIRIDAQSLDLLTSAATNLSHVARRRELANARRLQLTRELTLLAREAEDLGPVGAALAARLGKAKELAAELHREAKLLANEELRDLGQAVEEVHRIRMLPLSVLFEPYPRVVRDLARELGKEVELVVDGEDTRADRAVVEALREPLLHLIRNALDHGLETRVDRVASGKRPKGCLTLRATREGNRIVLRVEDDGMGLDPAMLRRVAVRRGFLDETAAGALSDAAARDLVFLSGFSSREVATDLSGRGVGLDAVRSAVQGLGGDASVVSAVGVGTIFEVRVPVSLTVAPLLFVKVGQETLALSATHVSQALKLDLAQLGEVAGRPTLDVEGRVLPFAHLSSVLGLAPERPPSDGELVLVVRSQGATAALAVERVLEERVQAILPLRGLLGRFAHLAGATTLADGKLAMVVSAAYLTASAQGSVALKLPRAVARAPDIQRRRILVVDDSPLTRELISALLEAVGYDITTASDGVEALHILSHAPADLVVTDLEMPGLDGLELTRQLKSHETLNRLPVIILTTRGGEEDRQRGLAAGADGYITKGDLVRQDLVDVVKRLLG
ncbi:two-component system, chemotaxis family, sensor histidine kinase and response regulator WspE [Stigmatella aurantiaca]|uniref:histidine kinase n=1 Tax=Stigmatella aurantiaca TaxID=41 RepID=A0A1H7RWI7_STIAU|nr:response regulator [Stigmatella aurantiaca]SEL64525.1 two-component system, chemotaxis family, sensor histidine kinase and response regulator WspE [Stigmatella aurantiaca]